MQQSAHRATAKPCTAVDLSTTSTTILLVSIDLYRLDRTCVADEPSPPGSAAAQPGLRWLSSLMVQPAKSSHEGEILLLPSARPVVCKQPYTVGEYTYIDLVQKDESVDTFKS